LNELKPGRITGLLFFDPQITPLSAQQVEKLTQAVLNAFAIGPDAIKFVSVMKKLFTILIMLMYGFSSTGMTISLHYCCGKLKSIDWTVPPSKSCSNKQSMAGKPCCETKLISYKDKTDSDPSGFELKPVATIDAVQPVVFQETQNLESNERQLTPEVFTPPPLFSLPLYITFGVFRI
jgi:hypothetical protein